MDLVCRVVELTPFIAKVRLVAKLAAEHDCFPPGCGSLNAWGLSGLTVLYTINLTFCQ